MVQHGLSYFIDNNIEPILQAWEDFARTIEPPALTMNDTELRDHARQMLHAFAADLNTSQSDHERAAKSKGLGKRGDGDTAAETHAEARLLSGYTVVQLVSEYRALRSSVLTLWAADIGISRTTHMADVTRFNEAVDQALAESVARYDFMVQQSFSATTCATRWERSLPAPVSSCRRSISRPNTFSSRPGCSIARNA
jgi:hypothetical protein